MKLPQLLLTGLCLLVASASARTWTSTDGRTLEAEFVKLTDESVTVRRDSKALTIPLEKLSKADREWLADQAKPAKDAESPADLEAEAKRISGILEKMLKEEVGDDERDEVTAFFMKLLPSKGADDEDVEWELSVPHGSDEPRESILISADLHPKGDKKNRLMWFHIIFNEEAPESHAFDKFGPYPAMRFEDVHCFVTVNRTDVRGVASAESYKNDKKIDAIIGAIDLKTISKL